MWKIVYLVPCLASWTPPPPPWVHVFSKSSANSSLCTQCAAVASVDAYCLSVFYCRLCHVRNKHHKQDWLLRKIVVPPTQVKMSNTEIDSEIIVFDGGGGHMSPPIRPPDGIWWRSIPVRALHVEDEIIGDIGLSFPRINGTSLFIHLPCGISLEIISHLSCWITSNIWCFMPLWKTETSCPV